MSEENVEKLLEEAEGRTTREAKQIVAALRPKPAVEPSIRRKPGERRVAAVSVSSG